MRCSCSLGGVRRVEGDEPCDALAARSRVAVVVSVRLLMGCPVGFCSGVWCSVGVGRKMRKAAGFSNPAASEEVV
jgi:hypothetical protein